MSVLLLERKGAWRTAGLAAVSVAAILPVLPLMAGIVHDTPTGLYEIVAAFFPILAQSIGVSLAGAGTALLMGVAAGILHSFYLFRGAALFRFAFMIPVMVPPLLWAAGLKNLALPASFTSAAFGLTTDSSAVSLFHGHAGTGAITVMITFPIVMLATMSACSTLNQGQCDAARLAGGESRLFMLAAIYSLPAAVLSAFLGACLMLSCPGPGMALGAKTAVSEILVSFSAFYDAPLAAFQCVLLSAAVLLLALSILASAGAGHAEILSGSSRGIRPRFHPVMSATALMFSLFCVVLLVLAPLSGLLLPAFAVPDFSMLFQTLSRTLSNTLLYAGGAAAVATVLGTAAAFFMGKSMLHRNAGACVMLVIFSLPAALTALGFLGLSADAPVWTDFLFRSPAAVCLAQGIRLFPIPALLAARFFGSMPASWSWAAELHGISLPRFMMRIVWPMLARPVATGFMVAFLLAAADVGTVLLLHPPGAQNLPLAIFTIMANAPASLVAQLGAAYLVFVMFLMLLIGKLWAEKES